MHGATLIQASSATALKIQNATGSSTIFNVDTTGTGNISVASQATLTIGTNSFITEDSYGSLVVNDFGGTNTYIDSAGLYVQDVANSYANVFSLTSGGQALFQNSVDSDSAFQVQDASSDTILEVGTSGTSTALTVNQWGTGDLLDVTRDTDLAVQIDNNGNTLFKPVTGGDSTSAFQVQDASGDPVLNVDTTNQRVGIGTATPSDNLEVMGANGTTVVISTTTNSSTDQAWLQVNNRARFGYDNGNVVIDDNGADKNFNLNLNGNTVLAVQDTGDAAFTSTTNSGTALQVLYANGGTALNLDLGGGVYPELDLISPNGADGAELDFQYGSTTYDLGAGAWASGFYIEDSGANTVVNIQSGGAIYLDSGITNGTLTADIAGTTSSHAVCHSGSSTSRDNVQIVGCTSSPGADYAERYPVASGITYGDIVATGTNMVNTYGTDSDGNVDYSNVIGQVTQMVKSTSAYQTNTIGIASNNYGEFTSAGANIKPEDNPMPVALNGRVPVNMAPDSPAIEPGDYVTTSGTYAGKAMKATQAGFVIGKALAAWDPASGQTQVMVFVQPGYWPGPAIADTIQNGGDATLANLTVTGTADFADLNASGTATINNLTVTTLNAVSATIGSLTVTGSAQFTGDITVGGHIITAGGQPTAQSGGSIGTGASVAVEGTDTTGTITITTGSNPSAGDLAKILFSKTYGAAPHVVLSPSNDKASDLHFYKGATTSTDFMFDTTDTPAPNTTYTFDYFIAQ